MLHIAEAICIAIGLCDVPLQTRAAPAIEPLPARSMLLQAIILCATAHFDTLKYEYCL